MSRIIDPTIGPVTKLWDFSASSHAALPSRENLEEALSHVGYQGVMISEDSVSLFDPQAEIDLGFIAKGLYDCSAVLTAGAPLSVGDRDRPSALGFMGWNQKPLALFFCHCVPIPAVIRIFFPFLLSVIVQSHHRCLFLPKRQQTRQKTENIRCLLMRTEARNGR